MRVATAVALAACVGIGAASRLAHADAVMPPPEQCPDGTTPATGHCGPHCEPITCDSTADCAEGTCTSVDACVETLVCVGMVEPDADLSQYERPSYLGLCEAGACAQGECQTLKICTTGSPTGPTGGAPASDTGSSDSGGCGCSTAGSRSTPPVLAWMPVMAAAVALGGRRRRRERASNAATRAP